MASRRSFIVLVAVFSFCLLVKATVDLICQGCFEIDVDLLNWGSSGIGSTNGFNQTPQRHDAQSSNDIVVNFTPLAVDSHWPVHLTQEVIDLISDTRA